MNATSRFRLAPDASVAESDGEAVVLHLRTGRFFRVNRSGAPLLKALERAGGASHHDLSSSLVAAFGVDGRRATADVQTWLDQLRSAGLVVEIPPAATS